MTNFPFEPVSHGRRRPAHPPPLDIGNRTTIIFLTVCTADRKKILANEEAAGTIVAAWQAADHWSVGRYIILPDHIHLFCAPARGDAMSVQKWTAFWNVIHRNVIIAEITKSRRILTGEMVLTCAQCPGRKLAALPSLPSHQRWNTGAGLCWWRTRL